MNLTKLQELAAAHALGALDLADQALLEAALGAHRVVRTEVSAFRDIAASLASALSTPLAPTPALRARLLQRISELQPSEQSASPEPKSATGLPSSRSSPRRRNRHSQSLWSCPSSQVGQPTTSTSKSRSFSGFIPLTLIARTVASSVLAQRTRVISSAASSVFPVVLP